MGLARRDAFDRRAGCLAGSRGHDQTMTTVAYVARIRTSTRNGYATVSAGGQDAVCEATVFLVRERTWAVRPVSEAGVVAPGRSVPCRGTPARLVATRPDRAAVPGHSWAASSPVEERPVPSRGPRVSCRAAAAASVPALRTQRRARRTTRTIEPGPDEKKGHAGHRRCRPCTVATTPPQGRVFSTHGPDRPGAPVRRHRRSR